MENIWLKNCRILILSRSRSDSIVSHYLFPFAELVVPDIQEQEYQFTGLKIHTIPYDIKELGKVRNWVLDKFSEEIIIMVDDDVSAIKCLGNRNGYVTKDSDTAEDVVLNAAVMAKDLGVSVFGFNQNWNPSRFRPSQPFSLNSWVGGVIGVIGRKYRFNERNKLKVDVDFCLQCLLYDRIVFIDRRFSFIQKREMNRGGSSEFRTSDVYENEKDYLMNKWGNHLVWVNNPNSTGQTVRLNVSRKSSQFSLL